jgi:hypothetical protein
MNNYVPGLTTSSGSGQVSFSPTIAGGNAAPGNFSDGSVFSSGLSNIWTSFTGGIRRAIDGFAGEVSGALAGSGMVVGYDRSGAPIRQYVDQNTGAVYTGNQSGSWGGAPAGPQAYPERTIQNYQTGGPFNWIANMLSLPAPQPIALIGTTPGTAPSMFSAPLGNTGLTMGQAAIGAVALLAAVLLIRKAV